MSGLLPIIDGGVYPSHGVGITTASSESVRTDFPDGGSRAPQQPIISPINPSDIASVTQTAGLSPDFIKRWETNLPTAIDQALRPFKKLSSNDKSDTGFWVDLGDKAFIYRPQDGNIVSEGMGYWMRILTSASLLQKGDIEKNHQRFDLLLNGVLSTLNENGLQPWRMTIEEKVDEHSRKITYKVKPASLADKHSASDADIYIAWALIQADALVKSGVWTMPTGKENYYAEHAAKFLSCIKAYDIIETNGRKILTVSDSWGHEDLLKKAITINPSYIIPAAFEDFAAFDKQGASYWTQVRDNNLEVLDKAVRYSTTLYQEIEAPSRKENSIVIDEPDGQYLVFDWIHEELLDNLLKRAGYELTPYGIDELKQADERKKANTAKELNGDAVIIYFAKGKFLIKQTELEKAIGYIQKANLVPFVPDQLEVVVGENGEITPRIEFGERQLNFVENYDGIRGPKELGLAILRSNDIVFKREAQRTLKPLVSGKDPRTVRVGANRSIIPLSIYLLGAMGSGDARSVAAFETAFDSYVNKHTILDPQEDTGTSKKVSSGKHNPRYYEATIAILSLAEALSTNRLKPIRHYQKEIEAAPPIKKENPDGKEPTPFQVNGISIGSDFSYLFKYATNENFHGLHTDPQFPITSEKALLDAQDPLHWLPNDPEVHYNYASTLRDIGRYHEALEEFYKTLLLCKYKDNSKMVLAVTKSLESILQTLGFGEIIIGDLCLSIIKFNPELDAGVRLALRAMAIEQFNKAGNQVKALKQGEVFLRDYASVKDQLGFVDRIGNYFSGTPLPHQLLLAEVIAQMMIASSEYAHPRKKVQGKRTVHFLEFDPSIALQISGIITGNMKATGHGDALILLKLIYDLRLEVPKLLWTKIQMASAEVHLRMMYYKYQEITRALQTAGTQAAKTIAPLFEAEIQEAIDRGEKSQQIYMDVIEAETSGKKDPDIFVLQKALSQFIAGSNFLPKVYERQSSILRAKLRAKSSESNDGTVDFAAKDTEQGRLTNRMNHQLQFAVLINEILQFSLGQLSTVEFARIDLQKADIQTYGMNKIETTEKVSKDPKLETFISSHKDKYRYEDSTGTLVVKGAMSGEEKKEILAIFSSAEDKEAINRLFDQSQIAISPETARRIGLIRKASLSIATLLPSADPRNFFLACQIIAQADIYSAWAEILPDSQGTEKLELGLSALEQIPQIFLSNREHLIDLSIQALLQMSLLIHKQIRNIQGALSSGSIFEVENADYSFSDILKEIETVQGFIDHPELKTYYKALLQLLISKAKILERRYMALLRPDEIKSEEAKKDPIIRLFIRPENRVHIDKIFNNLRQRASNAWASLGDTTWWGANQDLTTINRAIGYYMKALEYDNANISALRGLCQLYLYPLKRTNLSDSDGTIYRTYKKALEAIGRGGTNDSVVESTLAIANDISSNIGKDPLAMALKGIYDTAGLSNENKAQKMMEALNDYGY